jgi:hypothetical protein
MNIYLNHTLIHTQSRVSKGGDNVMFKKILTFDPIK